MAKPPALFPNTCHEASPWVKSGQVAVDHSRYFLSRGREVSVAVQGHEKSPSRGQIPSAVMGGSCAGFKLQVVPCSPAPLRPRREKRSLRVAAAVHLSTTQSLRHREREDRGADDCCFAALCWEQGGSVVEVPRLKKMGRNEKIPPGFAMAVKGLQGIKI